VVQPKASTKENFRPIQPRIEPDFKAILWEPSNALFRNENDYRYFRRFCDKTARRLEGILPTNLWSRLIFQACEMNTAVRHGVIAIAAIDVTSELAPDRANHYRFAIQHYSLALRHMQNEMTKRKLDLATALITNIIIICFETYHGNIDSAFNQITIGLRMIEEAAEKESIHGPFIDGIAVSVLPTIDGELIRAFARLSVQAASFVKNRMIPCRAFGKDFGLANLNGMPARFRSLSEAKNYAEIIVLQYVQLNAVTIDLAAKNGVVAPKSDSMGGGSMVELQKISTALRKARKHYLGLVTHWHEAFEPLLVLARTANGGADFLVATILELRYQALRLSINIIPVAGMPDMIDYMPYFEEIVTLCRQVLEHSETIHNDPFFTFESEVVLPLYVVGARCPYAELRREAIDLLRSKPRRENLWDGKLAARLAEWVMNVEEENLKDGYVPTEMRMTDMVADFDMVSHTAYVAGFIPQKDSGEPLAVKAELSW
jgi:Fungal specific transcription factor domain